MINTSEIVTLKRPPNRTLQQIFPLQMSTIDKEHQREINTIIGIKNFLTRSKYTTTVIEGNNIIIINDKRRNTTNISHYIAAFRLGNDVLHKFDCGVFKL